MKVYCLPDVYEIFDSSLVDIKYVLNPTYVPSDITNLDTNVTLSRCLDGSDYLPGIVGLNNIKINDSINCVLQALAHISSFRNFFLLTENYSKYKSSLVHRFGDLVHKIWNPKNFKSHVSPHEVLQAIAEASNKKYKMGVKIDPIEFMIWFLHTLHTDLGGTKKPGSSIVFKTFQGLVQIITEKTTIPTRNEKKKGKAEVKGEEIAVVPFLYLALEIPPPPLYKDAMESNVIPQVPIDACLAKFDGKTPQDLPTGERKRYIIKQLPDFLILHLKRFQKNNWFVEKNPTIVNFPLKNLDIKNYIDPSVDVRDLIKYDLVACIRHISAHDPLEDVKSVEGKTKGDWSLFIQHKGNEKWFDLQDLLVQEVLPQQVMLCEAYVLFFEKKTTVIPSIETPMEVTVSLP